MNTYKTDALSKWPSCLIVPSKYGSTTNCITVPVPSMTKLITMLIIGCIIFMVVAYLIYYFLNKSRPGHRYNYWVILLILIIAGIIVSLINNLLF